MSIILVFNQSLSSINPLVMLIFSYMKILVREISYLYQYLCYVNLFVMSISMLCQSLCYVNLLSIPISMLCQFLCYVNLLSISICKSLLKSVRFPTRRREWKTLLSLRNNRTKYSMPLFAVIKVPIRSRSIPLTSTMNLVLPWWIIMLLLQLMRLISSLASK